MSIVRSVLLLSLSLVLISNQLNATEWILLGSTDPESVARISDSPYDPPICVAPGRDMVRVGWLNEEGVCTTAGTGKNSKEHSEDISLLAVGTQTDEIVEWVLYEGEIPEGAVLNERDGNPVCRGKGSGRLPFRVGWLDEEGICKTAGKGSKVRSQRKNISILVGTEMMYDGDPMAYGAEEDERKPYDPAHEMSLSNAVINYGEFCGNNGYQLPGHGPLCEEAASIVKSDNYDGDIIAYAVNNYGEFCGNNGYQLPGHGPVCAAAASIVKSDDGVYDPEDRIDAEELMFQEQQEDQERMRAEEERRIAAEDERMRAEEERMRAEEDERMRAEEDYPLTQEQALNNLSYSMEELFSTCDFNQGGGNYDNNCMRGCDLSLVGYRNRARHALNEIREKVDTGQSGVRPLLGKIHKHSGSATWNQDGVSGDLGFFIANIGQTNFRGKRKSYLEQLSKCGEPSRAEKLKYFENFRDLLTDACSTSGGTLSGYTSGNGFFIDEGSYSDWSLGQCK